METIRIGSRGPLVQLLQIGLRRSNTYRGELDGIFGPQTQSAVRAFQSMNGLQADGIVGSATWRALRPFLERTLAYTIRPGDTLGAVARAHNVTIRQIMAANPQITDMNRIYAGDMIIIPWPGSVVSSEIQYSSDVMMSDLAALKRRFSFLGMSDIGYSVMGIPIPLVRFGRGNKVVLYNASHHANEWITTPIIMRFLEIICMAVTNETNIGDRAASDIFDDISLFVVPMLNPDGVNLVTGQIQPGSPDYQRAYDIRGYVPFPSGWKANIRGVDLNNNYPALFEEGKLEKEKIGIDKPAPRDYPGPYALSEPESAAMAAITEALEPGLTIALHTQGREIYWRFNEIIPPDGLRIGEIMAKVSGYVLADPPGKSFGGYKDWFIQDFYLPGYTIEIGKGVNPLPVSEFNTFYNEAEPILITGMLEVNG